MISEQEFTRRMVRTVATAAGVALLLAALYAARDALMLIYVSALVSMGFSPLVRLITRPAREDGGRGLPRVAAVLVIYLTIVAALVLLAFMVVPPLVDQATALWANMPQHFDQFQELLIRYNLMTHRVTLQEAVQNAPAGASGNAVTTVLTALWSVVGGVFGVVTILILSFYFLIEAESLFHFVVRFVPEPNRAGVATGSRQAVAKVSAWLRAQFVLAGVMGVFAATGLALLGVPYFYVVALVAAVGETIPYVGPIIGGITAVTVAITVSPKLALMVGVYFLILHQLEANVLVPKIMERRVGVSPAAVMMALLIGAALWGLMGAILAIPTVAILSVVIEEIASSRAHPTVHRAAG
jgi:predicted PurR-regulated permease PerM